MFLQDERLRRGVELREQFEQGLASEKDVKEAYLAARIARKEIRYPLRFIPNFNDHSTEAAPGWAAGEAANAATGNYHAASDFTAYVKACAEGSNWQASYDTERAAQCDLLRSMVSNPFRQQ